MRPTLVIDLDVLVQILATTIIAGRFFLGVCIGSAVAGYSLRLSLMLGVAILAHRRLQHHFQGLLNLDVVHQPVVILQKALVLLVHLSNFDQDPVCQLNRFAARI